ncbi:MAG TPA: endonuclease/exonuclease/phosphatase family protein [Bacteroidales bacterium]|nr:endonuclease/exonuclease/phosphatase family protein [Bacteroidales bacterium]HRX97054.1 endonuclease/exonuclease/phosphatase family protein [Bacteroidales bacterium]
MKSKTKGFTIIIIALLLSLTIYAQPQKAYNVACIGFYNLENLFDTINNKELFLSEEFTPESEKQWTSQRYHEKLNHMAEVISKIGTDVTPDGVALLGVSEIENRGVLEDLVKESSIADRDYQIVHYDSPDRRGVDVGLLYQPKYFEVVNSASHRLTMPDDTNFRTRDQLVVSGYLNGEMIHVIVNHWPSRSGGEKRSRPKRNAAGELSRHIVDSLLNLDPNAKILVMGDLNDDPVNPSVLEHLRAKGKEKELEPGDMYNPMYNLYREGIGSLAYRDLWNLFDQVIVSQALLGDDKSTYKFYKAFVFNKNFLKQKEGAFAGYPNRTFVGDRYLGGYSDHFPVYVLLIREKK